jgi:hypothetical protein
MHEQPDIHARLMSAYAQVPDWWYIAIFSEKHLAFCSPSNRSKLSCHVRLWYRHRHCLGDAFPSVRSFCLSWIFGADESSKGILHSFFGYCFLLRHSCGYDSSNHKPESRPQCRHGAHYWLRPARETNSDDDVQDLGLHYDVPRLNISYYVYYILYTNPLF